MLYTESKFNPDTDSEMVSQESPLALSEVLATGVVPAVISEDEYVELDSSKGLSRPTDVFDAIEMQSRIHEAAKASATSKVTESTPQPSNG